MSELKDSLIEAKEWLQSVKDTPGQDLLTRMNTSYRLWNLEKIINTVSHLERIQNCTKNKQR